MTRISPNGLLCGDLPSLAHCISPVNWGPLETGGIDLRPVKPNMPVTILEMTAKSSAVFVRSKGTKDRGKFACAEIGSINDRQRPDRCLRLDERRANISGAFCVLFEPNRPESPVARLRYGVISLCCH